MEKKIFLIGTMMMLILLFNINLVAGQIEQNTNVVIDVEVRVQRTADNVYELSLTNQAGTEKKIINVGSPPFSTHVFKLNYGLNESQHCTRSSNVVNQYQALSTKMTGMLDICQSAVANYDNNTANLKMLSDSQLKQTEFESLWNVEKNKREILEKTSTTCEKDVEDLKKEKDQLQGTANLAIQRGTELTVCNANLEKAEDAKTNNLIIGAILGLIGGYMFWGKNKNEVGYSRSRMPPEQEELMEDYY